MTPPHTLPGPLLRRARSATSLLFVANGIFFASFVPRIPDVSDRLDLSPAELGAALAGMPAGALAAGLLAGPAVARFGGGRVALVCQLVFGLLLWAPGVAPSWLMLAAALAVFGALDAVVDVAMNAHGIAVQHGYGRSILNGFHGWWSVGAVVGAGLGAGAAGLGVPVGWHLGVVGAATATVVLCMRPLLLTDEAAHRPADPEDGIGARNPVVVLRALGLLSLFAMLAVVLEDVPGGWSALYLRDELGASPGVAGAGFVAFSAAMTLGRFVNDSLVTRLGAVRLCRTGGAAAAVAFTVVVTVPDPVVALVGLAVAGFGTSSLFPAMLTAAAARPGVDPGHALAVISWVARVGFLLSPPLVGAISQEFGLPWGLSLAAVAGAGITLLASSNADRRVTRA